ncbi:MAG TPA: glycerol-3-phosphate dehydrogenase [Flavobacteriales bacterium]|nr:NAD(P)H-dependent glycerol-3-phosphate dehydrogenase [Salibacteraceae bacterium]HAS35695.1 glycerol-3-phosphate dehydrogenase [Flavobacteriales bacterium]
MFEDSKIGVIGGGSWATAIAKILTQNVDHIYWWMRNHDSATYFRKFQRNPKYLPSIRFDKEKITVSTDLEKVINKCDVLFMVHPSAFLYDIFEGVQMDNMDKKMIISAIKGIVPEYNAIPARFFHKSFGIPYENIAVIGGPCHAEEVAMEKLSYLTVACQDEEKGAAIANLLNSRFIKTDTTTDIFGVELGAVLKNIYAITAGIYHGLGYGDNFQALLISNAIQEMDRFVAAVSQVVRDTKHSGYLGDLLVTAYSPFSRNRTFGSMIGKGFSVRTAQFEMNMVAEGYYAAKSIVEINKKFGVEIPIVEATYRILYEKISPVIEMNLLTEKLR